MFDEAYKMLANLMASLTDEMKAEVEKRKAMTLMRGCKRRLTISTQPHTGRSTNKTVGTVRHATIADTLPA